MATNRPSGTAGLKSAVTGNAPEGDNGANETGRQRLEKLQTQVRGMSTEIEGMVGAEAARKFVSAVIGAILSNQDLIDADRATLFTACRQAAQDGLIPDGKQAVLNVYNTKVKVSGGEIWVKKVQYIPMVGGLVKMLYESGEVTKISAHAIYENDYFDYQLGDEEFLRHKPAWNVKRGKVIGAYMIATLANGEVVREVMSREDIDSVRAASKSSDGPGWTKWYDQFAIKSAIKRGYKRLPKTPAFEKIEAIDNEAMGFEFDDKKPAITGTATPALTHQAAQTSDSMMGGDVIPADQPDPVQAEAEKAPPQRARTMPEPEDINPTAECVAAAKAAKNDDGWAVALDWYSTAGADKAVAAIEMQEAAKRLGIDWKP